MFTFVVLLSLMPKCGRERRHGLLRMPSAGYFSKSAAVNKCVLYSWSPWPDNKSHIGFLCINMKQSFAFVRASCYFQASLKCGPLTAYMMYSLRLCVLTRQASVRALC